MAGWRHPAGEGWSAPGKGTRRRRLGCITPSDEGAPGLYRLKRLRKSRYPGTLFRIRRCGRCLLPAHTKPVQYPHRSTLNRF
ncbi:hypothetical protein MBOURGENBZM_05980 [Methanoculleus bourgensis]|nr:hypothetical protein MBOURGENBZM_05980 [Methanoculleus bourgensis]